MRIKFRKKGKRYKLRLLSLGGCFLLEDEIFMILENDDEAERNCVYLHSDNYETGRAIRMADNTMVTPINLKLVEV